MKINILPVRLENEEKPYFYMKAYFRNAPKEYMPYSVTAWHPIIKYFV